MGGTTTAAAADDQSKLPAEPIAAANGHSRMDPEAESARKKEQRRQKRKKMGILFFALFTLFQIVMLLVTVLVVMKIRTPQFRVRSATFDVVSSSSAAAPGTNPSFNITMIPNVGIKNTNFGAYRYGEATVTFFYRGIAVGSAVVHKSKVGMRSTKKVRGAAVELSSAGITAAGNDRLGTELGNDLRSGKLPLTSQARLNGKVEMMFIIKRKKGCNMNCSMQLDIPTRELHQINCN